MPDLDFNRLENLNCLVTGGAGFVGSNLVKKLLQFDVRNVTIIDNLLSAERTNIPDNTKVEFIEGSASDDEILTNIKDKYDFIFHLVTYHGNQSSIHDPLRDHENNLLPTLKLLEKVRDFKKLKKLVYSSAGCAVAEKTFGEARATREDAPISIEMDSPYSISKIVGEFYMVYYHRQHNVPTVRARFQNVYGPGEILGAGRWRGTPATIWRNVTPAFIYKALKKEPLPLHGRGEASRDFIFIDDIVRGLIYCALNGASGDVYNLSSGTETQIQQLAEIINKTADNEASVTLIPARKWDRSGHRYGDPTKANNELGFVAQTNLEEGIAQTVQWTKEHLGKIDNCIAKHKKNLDVYLRKERKKN
jgi:nucleoside-diphosphate-sugar epimerase